MPSESSHACDHTTRVIAVIALISTIVLAVFSLDYIRELQRNARVAVLEISDLQNTVSELQLEQEKNTVAVDSLQEILKPGVITNTATITDTSSWLTHVDDTFGFSFVYPENWILSTYDREGDGYTVVARVTNPDRAGAPDSDVPIEQFFVTTQDAACASADGLYTWEPGFGNISYASLCFDTPSEALSVTASAFDEESQEIMNTIMSSFELTQ